MSVTRFYDVKAKTGRGDTMRQVLVDLAVAAGAADGCEGIDVLADRADADRFLLVERWASEEAHGTAVKALPADLIQSLIGESAAPLAGSYFDTIQSV